MAARPLTDDAAPLTAADVARGTSRLLLRHDLVAMPEVPLPNGRRADLMAVCSRGTIVIVEIKVSRADLLGDGKWPDYLDYCDRFYWAVPGGFDLSLFEREGLCDGACGLIVADRYDAAIVREPAVRPLAAARRKAEVLRFGRRAARRLLGAGDPDCESAG
ncbi:hypothetical protein GGR88_002483 [Sphingomonas jejuensis]|uniref:DNA repair protein MmcB-related protein n=1 Tax=Sphingomonas jejuensis TaxID=904715 RepID=A0ABX0XNZ8_9SPHN|nr:MmcB family DNA repair protein [Sphingomonas jejuensis]NJC34969.1 hypothetical protein [Sphingomonas jejuensis]